ncbi:MAG: ATP-binding protein [Polyangiaceae bacterium]|nr:ATP-binding protein [Polyangiaceae bacterium]
MLLEFRVENHRSVRVEQALNLEVSPVDTPGRAPSPERPLAIAAIYGANASGKSNNGALRCCEAVVHSSLWPPEGGVRDPFAFDESANSASTFEVSFLVDGIHHRYGFAADDQRVLEEWLHVSPHGRTQVWFQREGDLFKFGEHLKGENRLVEKVTRANGLFLSAAAQNRHEQLSPIYRWFRALLTENVATRGRFHPLGEELFPDASLWFDAPRQPSLFPEDEFPTTLFRDLLRAADVGIVDFQIRKPEAPDSSRSRGRPQVFFQHKAADGASSWLPLSEESHGTRRLVGLAPRVLDVLTRGRVLVVDELESGFHPLLAQQLVSTFKDPIRNPRGAQLIFTTHDTNLLGTTMGSAVLFDSSAGAGRAMVGVLNSSGGHGDL